MASNFGACLECGNLMHSFATIVMYRKTSLNRPALGLILSGPFKEGSVYIWAIVWNRNKAIDVRKWSNCEGSRLRRFYCMCIYKYICSQLLPCVYIYIYI